MARKEKIKIASPDQVDEFAGDDHGNQDAENASDQGSAAQQRLDETVGDVDEEMTPAAEIEALKDKLLRARAELQNLQRRSRTEVEQAVKYANTHFARGIVTLVDDFDRTLDAAGGENATVESVMEGVTLIRNAFLKVLADQGVKTVEAEGRPFDPHFHEAVMQQPSDEHPDQTILQQVEQGYTLFDRVLRPAKVIVSKASADASTASEEGDADPSTDV
jgi:molecular chaperone GrpE